MANLLSLNLSPKERRLKNLSNTQLDAKKCSANIDVNGKMSVSKWDMVSKLLLFLLRSSFVSGSAHVSVAKTQEFCIGSVFVLLTAVTTTQVDLAY